MKKRSTEDNDERTMCTADSRLDHNSNWWVGAGIIVKEGLYPVEVERSMTVLSRDCISNFKLVVNDWRGLLG